VRPDVLLSARHGVAVIAESILGAKAVVFLLAAGALFFS
jgi:hypothetical protein